MRPRVRRHVLAPVALTALLALVAALVPGLASASAPVPEPVFDSAPGFRLDRDDARVRADPSDYRAFDVDLTALRGQLARATEERATTVTIPAPDGSRTSFAVVADSVMVPVLQAAHPEIRTYAGRSTDGTDRTVRLDVTPMGFHASVRGAAPGDAWLVDPAYDRRGTVTHLSYHVSDLPAGERLVERGLVGDLERAAGTAGKGTADRIGDPGAPVTRKTFRLALVTDPTYAAYFGTANVFAEKVTLINRVNQVYNDDLAIHFVLSQGTDTALNLDTEAKASGPDGPCGASPCYDVSTYSGDAPDGCTGALLDRTEWVLGQLVGADTYDIGHIGLGVNGGGIAGLGVVGGASKANGCTGLPFPEGDFYAIDYVAHEIGHQMGGDHTFNGTQVNCSTGNRTITPRTSQVEPGSGSTVMGYAGICGQDNLQPHSDPYFSHVSIEQIGDTVADDTVTVDEEQTVTLAGFDADGDSFQLTYPGADPVTVTRGTGYTSLQVAQKITQLTGCRVTLGGYDSGSPALNDDGFRVRFNLGALLPTQTSCRRTDVERLGVANGTGGVTGFVGVQVDGGETTNEGTDSAPANTNPTVTAPADKTIPIRTPFTLTGSGTDADAGQDLVYLWEQTDPGGLQGTALTSNTKTSGPLFRVFGTYADVSREESLTSPSPDLNLATGDPSRTFPDLAQVVGGTTNAETGTCPAPPTAPDGGATNVPVPVIECYAEFLPTAGYANNVLSGGPMHFRLSARDRFATGGGYAYDDVTITPSSSAGPFLVTSRASAGTPASSAVPETITWDVAGTNSATFATHVRITLSTDGGATFPYVLAESTPNDGSQQVTWPEVDTDTARVMVSAVGNYFFDVNDADFAITPGGTPPPPTTGDTTAPDTRIVAGPHAGSFVVTRKVTFGQAATEPGSSFVCGLDGTAVPCGARTRIGLREGTHTWRVAARDAAGNLDPTPATRTFASPFNDGKLRRATKGWKRVKDRASYRGAYLTSSKRGQSLTFRARRVTKIALVVHTGPGYGRVAVSLAGRRLRTVSLAGPARKRVVIPVKRLAASNGVVRITTLDTKPVRIDGLGLLSG